MRNSIKLFNDFDLPQMFNDWTLLDNPSNSFFPTNDDAKFDIKEFNDKVEIVADIPGFSKDNIEINYEKNHLTISGKLERKEEKENIKYLQKEITNRQFKRIFYLNDKFDVEKIEAIFKSGILTVSISKNKKDIIKQIEIK